MAPSPPRLRILSVGGNAVSAFLSWRLQATNACDVTLVWKSGFEQVSQYGISFKSKQFGIERFKPFNVVRAPEDAANPKAGFDYVLLCVKALPDVYDLAGIIESVVTPQHTCILINTTNSLGIESHLEERFPTNVVLSLVSGAELQQLGPSEFEHVDSTDVWVGAANKNPSIPASIQSDMAEALAMTLLTGQVDCKVSPNIRQQQYNRMIGPIAFHPLSVLFETPNHTDLIEKIGVQAMVSDIIDELLQLAILYGCSFSPDFKNQTIDAMIKPSDISTVMYQDFVAKRPMEIETFLGSPIKLAQAAGVKIPRLETIYSLIHNLNVLNQNRPAPSGSPPPPTAMGTSNNRPPPRMSSANYGAPGPGLRPMNGMPHGMQNGNRSRTPSMVGGPPPPPPRRGGPNGMNSRGPQQGPWRGGPPAQLSRRPSFENGDLGEEFSHLALIDDIPEGEIPPGGYSMGMSPNELDLRERELALKHRELQLREREMGVGKSRRGPPQRNNRGGGGGDFDDDDDDDFFDPMVPHRPIPHIDPDNFDMMSVTSRKNRKAPNASQFRKNPETSNGPGRGGFFRPQMPRNRSSQQLLNDVPTMGANIMADPLMGYSSNRYGTVDRKEMANDQRTDSLTRERLDQLAGSNMPGMAGAFPNMPRRISLSPAETFVPNGRRQSNRPSPPGGGLIGGDGRPSPPGMMRQPIPRYPPGQGNAVAPQQVEQYAGVSKQHLYNRPPQVRSLTGSASASAGSGESALIDSENSAHSSQSSFAPRPPIGVR